jgi:hypothetical protein
MIGVLSQLPTPMADCAVNLHDCLLLGCIPHEQPQETYLVSASAFQTLRLEVC